MYFSFALLALRYIFLLFLLLFIFRLVKWMINDLRETDRRHTSGSLNPADEPVEAEGRLVVLESSSPGLEPGELFGVGWEILIGRGGRSDIVIKDSFASTEHARVFIKDEQYWLEDLKSTNGTYLNEVRVKQPIVLANKDKIRVGGVTFQFVRWGHEVG